PTLSMLTRPTAMPSSIKTSRKKGLPGSTLGRPPGVVKAPADSLPRHEQHQEEGRTRGKRGPAPANHGRGPTLLTVFAAKRSAAAGARRLLAGQGLDLVVVVVVADERQQLRRSHGVAGDVYVGGGGLLQEGDRLARAILEVVGHVLVDPDVDAVDVGPVHRQLQHAHHVDAHALGRLDLAGAGAVRAVLVDAALQRRPDALAGHLDDAELRDLEDLGAGPVA